MQLAVLIVAIIAIGGLLGGTVAYFLDPSGDDQESERRRRPLLRAVVLGLAGSFTAALVLRLLPGGLGEDIFDANKLSSGSPALWDLLALFAFCIVLATFAPRALNWLSDRIFGLSRNEAPRQRLRRAAADTGPLPAPAAKQEPKLEVDRSSKPPAAVCNPGASAAGSVLTEQELRVLQSAAMLTQRTATGIARDAKVPVSQIGELLDTLADKGFVTLGTSARTGGVRWRLTAAGVAQVNAARKRG